MLNVGVTGGIASGKSTVVRMFLEKGAVLIDHDLLAHAAYEPGGAAFDAIVEAFGREVVAPDGGIDRKNLGEKVFRDPGGLERLNRIVHPAVFEAWQKEVAKIEQVQPEAVVLSDVPLLIEVGWQDKVDLVLLVYSKPEIQSERLKIRNGYSAKEAGRRIEAQMPIDEKRKYADIIIENSGTLEDLKRDVDAVWRILQSRERTKRLGAREEGRRGRGEGEEIS